MLRAAAMELKLVFREQGLVDHSEIAAIARQALNGLRWPRRGHAAPHAAHLAPAGG